MVTETRRRAPGTVVETVVGFGPKKVAVEFYESTDEPKSTNWLFVSSRICSCRERSFGISVRVTVEEFAVTVIQGVGRVISGVTPEVIPESKKVRTLWLILSSRTRNVKIASPLSSSSGPRDTGEMMVPLG